MRGFVKTVKVIALFLACLGAEGRAEEPRQDELSAEGLLFLEVPVVVTASRKEQPITEAPAAVTVIGAEEIRRSGALTIPDLLRTVSGVDVITFSARDQQVGIRGINTPLNNKLLVMIDGRSVYLDIFGNVLWQLFPIGLEEIERIEVIKSPASSLYGANAFSGVVNIITKPSRQLKGTEAHLTAGSRETAIASAIHADAVGSLHYKLSAGFDRTDEWGSGDRAGDIARGNFSLGYDPGPERTVSLSGGRGRAEETKLFVFEGGGSSGITGNFDYLQLDYRYPGLKARAYWKGDDFDVTTLRTEETVGWQTQTYDADVQYAFAAGKSQSFVTGVNYRRITLRKNAQIPEDRSQNLYALFLEDEVRLSERLRLIAGGRYDHHPLVKGHFSPRGTILYTPAAEHVVRLSAARAFRNPSLIDSFLHFEQPILLPPGIPFTLVSEGNPDLDSEGITAYELGYRGRPARRAALEVNLFYNRYADLFSFTNEVTADAFVSRPVNGGDAWGIGGEVDLNILVTEWLTLFANYSYQQITDKDDNPVTLTVNEEDRRRYNVPAHKVNGGIRMKFQSGLATDLLLHWVDDTERLITDVAGNEFRARTDPYTIVNGRVGYAFWKGKAEVSLYVFNLFNDRHFEYPPGIDLPGINLPERSSDPVGRKVALKASCRF